MQPLGVPGPALGGDCPRVRGSGCSCSCRWRLVGGITSAGYRAHMGTVWWWALGVVALLAFVAALADGTGRLRRRNGPKRPPDDE
jgi:hypothetical protein